MIIIIVKWMTIVFILVNTKLLQKIYVIYKIVYPKKFSLVFHHELNYDYHFFIKELATKFQRKFNCLGEETEK